MKKCLIAVIALIYIFLSASVLFAAVDTWTQKADFGGTARDMAVGFSIGSKGYIGTGKNTSALKDFWEYDPSTNTWSQKADFGGAVRGGGVGFSIGSKGYIGTGFDWDSIIYYKDFWEYDPTGNTWTQKADFGGEARYHAVGFSIESKGYIGTGSAADGKKNDFWEYDPSTNKWTQKADFGGTVRYDAVGFSIGSKGYIGTGYYNPSHYKDFWEYDPTGNSWTQKADFGGGERDSAVGFSIGSKGYIGTGMNSSLSYLNDFWEYDPTGNAWTQKADFGGTTREYAVGFSIGSKGYIGTGVLTGGSVSVDFWEYESGQELLYGHFTGAGIWKWDGSAWSQLTSNNPEAMSVSGTTLYGAFAGGGIWKWDCSAWSQVTPNNPEAIVTSGSNLYGSFAGGGIWKWDGSAWSQVTSNNPEAMAVFGSTLYGAFTGAGIWKWNGSSWSQVTPNDPEALVTSGSNLYGDFGSGGIWKWDSSTWSQVTPNNPQLISATSSLLYGAFAGGGIWKWNSTTWSQVTPNDPQLMSTTDSLLYGAFIGGGIYKWNGSDWSQVTPNNPVSMAAGTVPSQIIADHTVVDKYNLIPQRYIDEIKKMWINIPGESHSQAYRTGMTLLMQQDNKFAANVIESGSPENPTDQHLRVSQFVRETWGWGSGSGEAGWYTWYAYPLASQPAVKDRIKNHIQYSKDNNMNLMAVGFGWCWDTTWTNDPGGTIDPVYNVRWAGSSDGGPDGNKIWGLDDDDYSLTGNRVNMNTYLNATEDYRLFALGIGAPTKVIFTTTPVDGYTGESGYQRYLKHEHIRNFVLANSARILFDYADILSYDDNGVQTTTSWTDANSVTHTYPAITTTNAGDGSIGHIGSAGAIRLAKAQWWMLARIAGWDGVSP